MNQQQYSPRIIHSWPAIAQALGVSVSTARRWHEENPMPIKQACEGGRIMVREDELMAWYSDLPGAVTADELR